MQARRPPPCSASAGPDRRDGRPARRRMRTLAALALVAVGSGAAMCRPPPDPDGEPSMARPLTLDEWQTDDVNCRKGDCADWYLVRLRDRGTLHVELAPGPAEGREALVLGVADHRAHGLAEEPSTAGRPASLAREVTPGPYFVTVRAPAKSGARPYRLRAWLEVPQAAPAPPPPPPEPRFHTLDTELLEVEKGAGGEQFVLFGLGRRDGMRPGQRGRLVQDGQSLGELEVRDVFPEGSRARLLGSPARPITPHARVEIDVPLEPEEP